MADRDISSLVVIDEGGFVGIFTERHYARNMFLKGRSSPQTCVGDGGSARRLRPPRSAGEEGLALMTDKRVRHLPVIDGGNLLGGLSIGDLVKSIISDWEFVIERLEHYIRG